MGTPRKEQKGKKVQALGLQRVLGGIYLNLWEVPPG